MRSNERWENSAKWPGHEAVHFLCVASLPVLLQFYSKWELTPSGENSDKLFYSTILLNLKVFYWSQWGSCPLLCHPPGAQGSGLITETAFPEVKGSASWWRTNQHGSTTKETWASVLWLKGERHKILKEKKKEKQPGAPWIQLRLFQVNECKSAALLLLPVLKVSPLCYICWSIGYKDYIV